jgi:hypothetical protein
MRTRWKLLSVCVVTAGVVVGGVPFAAASRQPVLYGTTGACNNAAPGGPCTETSELVQLDPATGAVLRDIGPVGFTVNGLAWDRTTRKLYASTAIGDVAFHGLITINIRTGAGSPIDATVHNFGLSGADSPIHSIAVDRRGRMVAWYDEKPAPGVTDTFVTLDKRTGLATEFPDTGIDTAQNGIAFDEDNRLWNIDTTRRVTLGAPLTQTAYRIDPTTGVPIRSVVLTPPTPAALGDFNPENGRYYGLNFTSFSPGTPTFVVVVNVRTGSVTTLGQTADNLHTLAFVKD